MSVEKKPSEKVIANSFDGKEIKDSLGRPIVLRKYDILDMYDLFSAMGDDAKNPACMMMAVKCLYVAKIDGQVVESPKSYAQVRATLKRIGSEGINAIDDFLIKYEETKSEKETLDSIKK